MIKRLLVVVFCGLFHSYFLGQTAEDFFDEGIKKFKLQDYNGALDEFNKAIELNPKYAKAYNNRGIVRGALNDISGSIEDFNTAITLEPINVSAYRNLGLSKFKLQYYEGAISAFNKVLQFKPNDEVALKNLILSKKLLQDRANKQIELKQVQIKPIDSSKINLVKMDETTVQPIKDKNVEPPINNNDHPVSVKSVSKNETIINNTKKGGYPEELVNSGRLKTESHDYWGAFEDFSRSIELDSENAQAYYYRGLLKMSLRNYKGDLRNNYKQNVNYGKKYQELYVSEELLKGDYGAIEDFTKAIQFNSNFAEAYYKRAVSLYNLKKYKNALVDFNKAIEINPNLTDAYYYRGISKGILNDMSGACLDFIKAAELGNNEAKDLIKECQ